MRISIVLVAVALLSACGGASTEITWPRDTPSERCIDRARAAPTREEEPAADSVPSAEHLRLAQSANVNIACDPTMDSDAFVLSEAFLTSRAECLSQCVAAANTATNLDELTSAEALWRQCVNVDRTCASQHTIDVPQGDELSDIDLSDGDQSSDVVDESESFRSGQRVFAAAYRRLYEQAQAPESKLTLLKHLIAYAHQMHDEVGALLLSIELLMRATTAEDRQLAARRARVHALLIQRHSLEVSDDPNVDYDLCNSLLDDTITELSRILDCENATQPTTVDLCSELRRARQDAHRIQ